MNEKRFAFNKVFVRAALFFFATLSCAAPIRAQTVTNRGAVGGLPPTVREQLQRNATAISAAHIEYSRAEAGTDIQQKDAEPDVFSAYLDAGRFYQRRQIRIRRKSGEVENRVHENAFDGKVFYSGEPVLSGGNDTAAVRKYLVDDVTDPDRTSVPVDIYYLSAAGFYSPINVAGLTSPTIESSVLHGLRESDNTLVERVGERLRVTVRIPDPILLATRQIDLAKQRKALSGGRNSSDFIAKQLAILRNMQNMEPKRTVVFLLDPKYGYGVVEREDRTAAGQRIALVVTDGWKHYEAPGIWLPNRCIESYYTRPWAFSDFTAQPMLTFTLQLDRVAFGHQENIAFFLDYKKAGARIADRTCPEARESPNHEVQYTVSADGVTLRDAAATALNGIDRGRSYFWLLWGNVAILIAVAIVFLVRRLRKVRAH